MKNYDGDRTKQYYDSEATEYCLRTSTLDTLELWQDIVENIPSGSQILDIGCGSGRDLKFFNENGFKPIGVEFSFPLSLYAKTFSKSQIICADFQFPPIKPNSFDVVWAVASLLHMPKTNLQRTLKGMHSILKNDGVFFCTMKWGEGESVDQSGRFFSLYTSNELRIQFTNAGFIVLRTNTQYEQRSYNENSYKTIRWINVLAQKPLSK